MTTPVTSDVIVQAGAGHSVGMQPTATPPSGYAPADLRSAYNITSAAISRGNDATVAVITSYDDPSAASDLAVYRAQYGLSSCTAANECFRKVNQDGVPSPLPPANSYLASTVAVGLDMVSAVCPNCHILLVEANSPYTSDTGTGVDSAVTLGARFVVFGTDYGYPFSHAYDQYFNHPGVAITAPAGDYGWNGGIGGDFPASLPYVTAVGGTSLTRASNARGWSETVWDWTGSGCTIYGGKPSWQTDRGCAARTDNDVAAVANPYTGVAFYNTDSGHGWSVAGGTAVSAAIVGGIYALAGTPQPGTFPATYPYLHHSGFYQVTGTNLPFGTCSPAYLCTAGPGYNGPAGWGTPDGTAGFRFGPVSGNYVAAASPGLQEAASLPATVSTAVTAVDSAAGQSLTYSASGLPAGVTINPATGAITGTVTRACLGTTTVTVTDRAGARASVGFGWRMQNTIQVYSPTTVQTRPGSAVSIQITASDDTPGQTFTYSAAGLPPGLSIDGASGTITGNTNSVIRTYHVTVTARDTTGSTGSGALTLRVWNQITVKAPSSVTAPVGIPATVPVTATDSASGHTLTYTATGLPPGSAGLPPGLTINHSTGQITGTPTTAGLHDTTITVTDGTGSAGTATIHWTDPGVITISNPGTQTVNAGMPLYLPVTVFDTAGYGTLSFSLAGQPAGLGIDTNDLDVTNQVVVTGFPLAAGTFKVTLTATGWYGAQAATTFTLQVNPATGTGPTGPVRLNLGGKCLDDTRNSSTDGTKVQIWTCLGDVAQNWTLAADGTIRIHGKCLDGINGSAAAGTSIELQTCDGKPSQIWTPSQYGTLSNPALGTCLADPGASTANGTQIQSTACGTGKNYQRWTAPAGPILFSTPGKCVDDKGAGAANGTPIQVYTCNGTRAQQWTIEPDGTIRLLGKCMTTLTGVGGAVFLSTCQPGATTQQWTGEGPGGTITNVWQGEHGCLGLTSRSAPPNGTQLINLSCYPQIFTFSDFHVW